MSETPVQRAERLLAEAERITTLSHRQRGAEQILLYSQLVDCLRDLRDYHEGHAEAHRELVKLVEGTLEAMHVSALNGSAVPWWNELPRPHSRLVSQIKRMVAWLRGER